jgi:hypothetical protein
VHGEGEPPDVAVQVPGVAVQSLTPDATSTGFPATISLTGPGLLVTTVPLRLQLTLAAVVSTALA